MRSFYFFFLTKPYLKYFDEISNGIDHLANGNFTKKVHISSNDEFGDILQKVVKISSLLT